jgi:hypothetical protein
MVHAAGSCRHIFSWRRDVLLFYFFYFFPVGLFRHNFAENGPQDLKMVYSAGYTLRSEIEASLINREVLPETYFLLVIMAAGAQA